MSRLMMGSYVKNAFDPNDPGDPVPETGATLTPIWIMDFIQSIGVNFHTTYGGAYPYTRTVGGLLPADWIGAAMSESGIRQVRDNLGAGNSNQRKVHARMVQLGVQVCWNPDNIQNAAHPAMS